MRGFMRVDFHPDCTNAEEITSDIQGVQQVANQFHFKGQLLDYRIRIWYEWHSVGFPLSSRSNY